MKTKHTSLPWHTDPKYPIYIWGSKHEMVADVPFLDEDAYLVRMRGVGRGATEEEQSENAKFVVDACNSHYELLEVTKELVNQLLTFRAEMRERFVNISVERTNLISAVLKSASEIVPKAEGR